MQHQGQLEDVMKNSFISFVFQGIRKSDKSHYGYKIPVMKGVNAAKFPK